MIVINKYIAATVGVLFFEIARIAAIRKTDPFYYFFRLQILDPHPGKFFLDIEGHDPWLNTRFISNTEVDLPATSQVSHGPDFHVTTIGR